MSVFEIGAIAATTVNTILLVLVGKFIGDVLKRVQIVEQRTYVKATKKNERLTLLEAFDAEFQRELAKIVLQMASLEQDLGQKLYKLRRSVDLSRMEDKKWRRDIDSRISSSQRSESKLEKTSEQIEKIARIIGIHDKKITRIERISKDYIMVKGSGPQGSGPQGSGGEKK